MGCLRCCALLVPALAVLGPLAVSVVVDGRVWDLIPGWRIADMPDLTGKLAIVTGPTVGGIGFESCVEMARKGAHVILAGRSESKGMLALSTLQKLVPGAIAEFMELDLSNLTSVKAFAQAFEAKQLPLHILLNNAGVMANPFTLSVDNLESQLATNHFGHHLLTRLLLPVLEKSAPSRIVTVSSAAAFIPEVLAKLEKLGLVDAAPAADFDKIGLDYNATYSPFKAYGRSKLANVLFTQALARRLVGKKVYANVCHPGGIATNLPRHVEVTVRQSIGEHLQRLMNQFTNLVLMTPSQGAVTQLYLATAPEIETKEIRGQYYRPQATGASAPAFATEERSEALWRTSELVVQRYLEAEQASREPHN